MAPKKTRTEQLAKAKTGTSRAKAPAQAGMVRKVLSHDEFGLCVLLPKTAWDKLPSQGPARVGVNGKNQSVVIHAERCNCRGDGWHEHRFVSFQSAAHVGQGDQVRISL
jgi:hypothetical protein